MHFSRLMAFEVVCLGVYSALNERLDQVLSPGTPGYNMFVEYIEPFAAFRWSM
jgi:hypothetical protein